TGLGAERRHLTVLFSDLVGSTALSADLDPEDMRDLIRAYQDACAGVITRFEGYIAKFMGDGVLAYFGFPQAHEDDAELAVGAGLSIIESVGRLATPTGDKLAARIGIATGIVVVGDLIGMDSAQERAVVGDAPNLAARLQSIGGPGQVIVSDATRRLLGSRFEISDFGAHDLKGLPGAVPTFLIEGERAVETRFEARTTEITKMVGRDQELALLLERWSLVKSGDGQAVLLVGEAGIGKSRIVRAFLDAVAEEDCTRIQYQCSPYQTDSALAPVIRQLRRAANLKAKDTKADQLAKLEKLLERSAASRTEVALISELFGLGGIEHYGLTGLPPGVRRDRTLEALTRQLLGLAADRPVVMVLEDAHWADPTTLELMELSLDAVGHTPVLVLMTSRPDNQPGIAAHPHMTRLTLNRLGRTSAEGIILHMGGEALPQETRDAIIARTDGVPLFVEELTKAILETGRTSIPSSLHDTLMARLDRIPQVKAVAQIAACIGREFDQDVLSKVCDLDEEQLHSALNQLTATELIFRRGPAANRQYMFKHALVRDAAYESLLRAQRQSWHLRIAEALCASSADALPEVVAHHFEQAGHSLTAADWYARAASSSGLDSPEEALRQWEKVYTLLAPIAQVEASIVLVLQAAMQILKFAWRQGMSDSRVEEVFRQAKALAVGRANINEQLGLLYGIGCHHMLGSSPRRSIPYFEESVALADPTGDPELRWVAREPFEVALWLLGELSRALRMNDEQIAFSEADPSIGIGSVIGFSTAFSFGHRGWILTELGRFDEASAAFQRCEELASRHGENDPMIMNDALHCGMLERAGDLDAALSLGRRAIETAELCGNQFCLVLGHLYYGVALTRMGEWHDARRTLEMGLAIARNHRAALFREPDLLAALAEAHAALGDVGRALDLAAEAIQIALRNEMPIAEVLGQLALARALRSQESTEVDTGIEAALNRAQALVVSTGARSYEPQICIEHARLSALRGEADLAQQHLREAYRHFSHM
ncbi:MAG: adenylate/guanylate cyclase domain-containing protein, partial [Geminicoccaceae bacterium]